jgi:hypothetical protein
MEPTPARIATASHNPSKRCERSRPAATRPPPAAAAPPRSLPKARRTRRRPATPPPPSTTPARRTMPRRAGRSTDALDSSSREPTADKTHSRRHLTSSSDNADPRQSQDEPEHYTRTPGCHEHPAVSRASAMPFETTASGELRPPRQASASGDPLCSRGDPPSGSHRRPPSRGERGWAIRGRLHAQLAASTRPASTNRRESDTRGRAGETIALISTSTSPPRASSASFGCCSRLGMRP